MNKKHVYIIVMILILSLSPISYGLTTINETVKEEIISSGVILKNYKRFTDEGWLTVNIIEVDLEDKHNKIDLLTSENGLNTFQTTLQMANNNDAIAAINGDFFGGNYLNGYPVGLSVKENDLLTSSYFGNEEKDQFATFYLSDSNVPSIDYFISTITLKSHLTGETLNIKEYNRASDNYDTKPAIFTEAWREETIGSTDELELTELIVKSNKVVEIRTGLEKTKIPENGFVVVTTGTSSDFIKNNFKVGTKVDLEISHKIDFDNIKTAISGGAVLVQNGEIPESFSSNITGRNPRTAIGFSKDKKTLYLVTVDGRIKESIGMTQTELASFLIEKGICEAINLDGGGSTTMVAKKLGDNTTSIINTPSGGVLRMVTNSLGIINTSKQSSLANLLIYVEDENVFVNCTRKITVKGYDKNYNPVDVKISDIKFTTSGVDGTVKDGILYAGNEAGTITITAKKGKASVSKTLNVLSAPSEISIYPKKTTINLSESINYKLEIKNKNGYYGTMLPSELTFKIISGDGTFKDNVFTPKTIGNHILEVSAGMAKTYAMVTVISSGDEITEIKSDLYLPQNVKGQDASNTVSSDEDVFRVAIYDEIVKSQTLLDQLKNNRALNQMDQTSDLIILNSYETDKTTDIKTPILTPVSYGKTSYNKVDIITIDVTNEGLRKTDSSQWQKLKTDIKNSNNKNIIILMKGTLDNFTDLDEKELFIDVISDLRLYQNKNIWVIEYGDYTEYSMEKRIKYLSVNNKNFNIAEPIEVATKTNYIEICVKDDEMTYEIKRVF